MAKKNKFSFNLFNFLISAWVVFLIFSIFARQKIELIPYSQFLQYVDEQKIESVKISKDKIEGVLKKGVGIENLHFGTLKVDNDNLIPKLIQQKIKFEAIPENTFLMNLFSWLLPVLLMVGFWYFLFGRIGRAQGQLFSLGKSKAKIYIERDLKVRFSDVAGVDEAKQELQELVDFLKDPSKFGRLGGRMPKGLLLLGSPGTGKTLLARAVAGEAQVPFFYINGSEFVEMFVGLGAARVRDLFEEARKHAPCIIFIDELDALGKARGLQAISGANDEKEQTLNQLLAELDGFDPSQGIVLLSATNRPEVLDPALLRSGRFDRQIIIDKPDRKGRSEILKIHLKNVQLGKNINLDSIASLTPGFSGADIANLANEAAIIATRRGANFVEMQDFTAAIERMMGGLERKSRILNAEEKKRIAYHEMGHAVLSLALHSMELVHKVSIIPRGIGALGYTMQRPIEDRYLVKKNELEDKLSILLGGRAAETIFFQEVSTGAADDLDKATDIARAMVTRFGMSSLLGLQTYDRELAPLLQNQVLSRSHDYSEETAKTIDQEVTGIINDAFCNAMKIIKKYREFVEEGVKILLEKETLNEETLQNLWDRHSKKVKESESVVALHKIHQA